MAVVESSGEENSRIVAVVEQNDGNLFFALVAFVFMLWGTQNKRNLPH